MRLLSCRVMCSVHGCSCAVDVDGGCNVSIGGCPQHLQSQLDVKRPLVEQCLEAGRFYLREEGHHRLSADSADSATGRCLMTVLTVSQVDV